MNIQVKLDNRERGYYASLYQAIDANNTNSIGGAQAVQFFKRSGLPIETLKRIWTLSSPNNQTLNKEEFYTALKLISYAQNNIEISLDAIQKGIPSPPPQFQTEAQQQEELYRIRPEQERLYQSYFSRLDLQGNTLSTQLALGLFQKCSLSPSQIQNIITLVDPTLPQKPRIPTQHYVVITHLISLASQGISLPSVLPKCLQDFLTPFTAQPNFPAFPAPNSAAMQQSNAKAVTQISDLIDFPTSQAEPISTGFEKASQNFSFDAVGKFNEQKVSQQVTTPIIAKSPLDKYNAFNMIDLEQHQPPTPQQTTFNHAGAKIVKQYSIENQDPKPDNSKAIEISVAETAQNKIEQINFQALTEQLVQGKQENQNLMQQQAQNLKETVQLNNELLMQIKEQNEKHLKYEQQQLEQINRLNEQYRTVIKKIEDENDLFNEQLKNIQHQKKKSLEQLSKITNDIYNKLGISAQQRQDMFQMQENLVAELANTSANSLGSIHAQFSFERDYRNKTEMEILKELRQQRDLLNKLTNEINELKQKQVVNTQKKEVDTSNYYQLENNPALFVAPILIEEQNKTKSFETNQIIEIQQKKVETKLPIETFKVNKIESPAIEQAQITFADQIPKEDESIQGKSFVPNLPDIYLQEAVILETKPNELDRLPESDVGKQIIQDPIPIVVNLGPPNEIYEQAQFDANGFASGSFSQDELQNQNFGWEKSKDTIQIQIEESNEGNIWGGFDNQFSDLGQAQSQDPFKW